MVEAVAAFLALLSAGIFVAHAVDAYANVAKVNEAVPIEKITSAVKCRRLQNPVAVVLHGRCETFARVRPRQVGAACRVCPSLSVAERRTWPATSSVIDDKHLEFFKTFHGGADGSPRQSGCACD